MVRLAPSLPWLRRQAMALISTTTLLQSSVSALATRSPEDATTVCGKKTLDDKQRDLECDVSRSREAFMVVLIKHADAANAWNPTSEGFQCLTVCSSAPCIAIFLSVSLISLYSLPWPSPILTVLGL